MAGGSLSRLSLGADQTTLACSFRSLTNPYHAAFNKGAQAFATSVGLPYVPLTTEGSSEKGIADIRALLQRTNGNLVLNVDPNDSADARVIVEACSKAGAYRHDDLEQAERPASVGLQPELRRASFL